MIGFDDLAWTATQQLYDDSRQNLADQLDEMLDVLETDPGDRRVRRHRMQQPKLWHFTVTGDGETWSVLWEPNNSGEPYIHFAGPGRA
ncbi:MAG: hypothetical protein FWD74_03280 [Actinomycetia bacterium]|nr:hypothetical protein [Actinomycetes bacterium]